MWLDLWEGIEISICDRRSAAPRLDRITFFRCAPCTSARGPHFQTPLNPYFWVKSQMCAFKKVRYFFRSIFAFLGVRSCEKSQSGWWFILTILKNMSSSVRKDYLDNIMENSQFHGLETTNQWLLTIINHHLPSLPHTKPMFETTNHQPPPTNVWNQPEFLGLVKSPFSPWIFATSGRPCLQHSHGGSPGIPLLARSQGGPGVFRNETGGFHGEDHGKIMGRSWDVIGIALVYNSIYTVLVWHKLYAINGFLDAFLVHRLEGYDRDMIGKKHGNIMGEEKLLVVEIAPEIIPGSKTKIFQSTE